MASHFRLFGFVLARFFFPQFSVVDSKMVQRSALCRPRRELSNEYLLAKFGFDTAENEPCKVCPLSAYRSLRWPLPDEAWPNDTFDMVDFPDHVAL